MRPGKMAVGLLLAGALVACSSSQDASTADTDTDNDSGTAAAWCAQLDELWVATAQLEEIDVDDPALPDALAALDEQVRIFDGIAAPQEIADDWAIVRTPPTTDASGRTGVDEEQEQAGDRAAAWALANCELSDAARAGLEG